jgi:hypothetical protein
MTDGEWKFPHWQAPLQDLILEFDSVKWQGKIREVEAVLFARLQQLDHGGNNRDEKIALQDTLSIVHIMKRDRLDSPNRNSGFFVSLHLYFIASLLFPISNATFQLPSACFFHTVVYLPRSTRWFPSLSLLRNS